MKLLEQLKINEFKSLKPLEIGALVLFVLFIILPFKLPSLLTNVLDSSFGLIFLFVTTLYLFYYTNPILGVIFILVAYELIRRSSENKNLNYVADNNNNVTQQVKDLELEKLNPVQSETLEEEVINKMVPARNEFIKGESLSDYKPNAETKIGASMFN